MSRKLEKHSHVANTKIYKKLTTTSQVIFIAFYNITRSSFVSLLIWTDLIISSICNISKNFEIVQFISNCGELWWYRFRSFCIEKFTTNLREHDFNWNASFKIHIVYGFSVYPGTLTLRRQQRQAWFTQFLQHPRIQIGMLALFDKTLRFWWISFPPCAWFGSSSKRSSSCRSD